MTVSKIAVEEHFGFPDIIDDSQKSLPQQGWAKLRQNLLDQRELLAEMDRNGVELALLSLTSPGIQAIPDRRRAVETARRANDYLAEQVARLPDRFQGLACVPLQDPEAAAAELIRTVKELGLKGTVVNGFSQVDNDTAPVYYDSSEYACFWNALESLEVPFYLHPRSPLGDCSRALDGCPWLGGAAWAFGVECATHALRLITSGLFDRHPRVAVVLGHLGETLPNAVWRIDHRLGKMPRGMPAKKKPSEYLRNHFYVSTSGNYCTHALMDAISELGADRILFAADYPFEDFAEAARWFDGLKSISSADQTKIAHTNAEKLFKLAKPGKIAASI